MRFKGVFGAKSGVSHLKTLRSTENSECWGENAEIGYCQAPDLGLMLLVR